MEENSRPASPDLAAAEAACRNELARTDSGSSSSVTVDVLEDSVRREHAARPGTAWTNAKHNLYLASLEASFVEELHQSLGLLSSHSEYSFTVLQDGFSRRIDFERSQPLQYNSAGSHFVKESSWMQRFRCSGKHNNISVNLQECSTFCREEMLSGRKRISTHGCHQSQQNAFGNIAEVSGQNFVDEDQEEKSLSLSRPKRLKRDAADSSTNDQVVPSGDVFSVEIATTGNNLLERKEQVDRKCHSDNINSLFSQDVM